MPITPAGGGGGGGTPGGSDTQIQFNDGNAFAGSASLTFNKTIKATRIFSAPDRGPSGLDLLGVALPAPVISSLVASNGGSLSVGAHTWNVTRAKYGTGPSDAWFTDETLPSNTLSATIAAPNQTITLHVVGYGTMPGVEVYLLYRDGHPIKTSFPLADGTIVFTDDGAITPDASWPLPTIDRSGAWVMNTDFSDPNKPFSELGVDSLKAGTLVVCEDFAISAPLTARNFHFQSPADSTPPGPMLASGSGSPNGVMAVGTEKGSLWVDYASGAVWQNTTAADNTHWVLRFPDIANPGVSGSFVSADAKTVTVTNGIITAIV